MRTGSLVAWILVGATLVTAACGSEDEKHVDRDAEAGAGGEAGAGAGGDVAAGGSETPAGGAPIDSAAGAPTNGGSGGGGGGGSDAAGGAGGGAGNAALTLESLTGSWTATGIGTYACESAVGTFEVKIDGANVSFPGWPSGYEGAGTIAAQQGGDGAFTFEIEYEVESEPVTMLGQLFVEPSARYGLLVAQSIDSSNDNKEGYMAVVQRTEPMLEVTGADFLGDWAGSSLRLDQTLAATAVLASSGTFASNDDFVELAGTDDDGAFVSEGAGEYSIDLPGIALEPIVQGDGSYAGAFLMSPDKQALAAMLLMGEGSSQYGLCNQQAFADISLHKFVLWTKAD